MWPTSLTVILKLDGQSPMQTCDSYLQYRDILSHLLKGMPCTQCAHSAKFWMLANTRTLVLAPFHKFLVPYQGFF